MTCIRDCLICAGCSAIAVIIGDYSLSSFIMGAIAGMVCIKLDEY